MVFSGSQEMTAIKKKMLSKLQLQLSVVTLQDTDV